MIRRAARPDAGFLMLRNDVARDERLSYRASGVLADILSRPDNWTTSADRLASARPAGEGRDAIRTALTELERAGYLIRRKVRGERGRYTWHQIVFDTPQADVSAGHAEDGKPAAGNGPMVPPAETREPAGQTRRGLPDAGMASPKEDLEEDHYEDLEEDDQSSPTPRSARRGPIEDDEHSNGQKLATATDLNDWRDADRKLFCSLIGEKLTSDGARWGEGTWSANQFYNAFRRRSKGQIRWPGRFMESLNGAGPAGIDNWLMAEGLEKAA